MGIPRPSNLVQKIKEEVLFIGWMLDIFDKFVLEFLTSFLYASSCYIPETLIGLPTVCLNFILPR